MSGPSYTGMVDGLRVTTQIDGAHPRHTTYPLLRGDLLIEEDDGSFYKFGPGLGITGFHLTAEQRASLVPVVDQPYGIGDFEFAFGSES